MTTSQFLVRDIRKISSNVIRLQLAKPFKKRDDFSFMAGQYVGISFKRFGRPTPMRFFSIANIPNYEGLLEFGIKVDGAYTNALLDLEPNDLVTVQGPYGDFTYSRLKGNQAIMLAGGIGITPILSLIRQATEHKLRSKIILLYANRNAGDIPYLQELLRLEKINPFLKTYFVISGHDSNSLSSDRVINGRINDKIISWATDKQTQGFSYFVCGPDSFMNSMTGTLQKLGVPEYKIISETFSATGDAQVALPSYIYKASFVATLLLAGAIGVSNISKYLPKTHADNANQNTLQTTNNATPSTSSNGSGVSQPTVQTPVYYQPPVSTLS